MSNYNNTKNITLTTAKFDNLWSSLREETWSEEIPGLEQNQEEDYEIEAENAALNNETADRVEHLNALIMARVQGPAALFSFLQDTQRPAWIRVRAVREMAKQEPNALTSPYYAILEQLRTASLTAAPAITQVREAASRGWNEMTDWFQANASTLLPGVGTCRLEVSETPARNAAINGLQAECVTEASDNGYTLGVDIRQPVDENVMVHVVLFDRANGSSIKHATAPLEKREELYHAELFEREKLSRAEVEHSDALFWIERRKEQSKEQNQD